MTIPVPKRFAVYSGIISAILLSLAISVILVLICAVVTHSHYYFFLLTNLALAYIPIVIAYLLVARLKTTSWVSFTNIVITMFWLGFLPNSFYMITDLIHAQDAVGIDLLYNIVMIIFCIFNSLVAGYISLYMIHRALIDRIESKKYAHVIITFVILLCSFAIYLGRYLRWNSWDVIFNPAGILFDVSDTIVKPSTHPELVVTTTTFFLLLGAMYLVIWQIIELVRKTE